MVRKRTLETCTRIFVPEVDGTIGACGRERAMYGVEVDIVHREDEGLVLLGRALFFPMALEREVLPTGTQTLRIN